MKAGFPQPTAVYYVTFYFEVRGYTKVLWVSNVRQFSLPDCKLVPPIPKTEGIMLQDTGL
jgi:hypothetical protein